MDVLSAYFCTAILAALGFFAQPFLESVQHLHSRLVAVNFSPLPSSPDVSRLVTDFACYESDHELDCAHPVQFKTGPVQHSLGHVSPCPACDAARREALMESDLAALPFEKAAPIWLERHKPYIAERTIHDYEQYISLLNKFFGPLILRDIHIGNVRAFHQWRLQTAGASRTRVESSTLRQIMQEAKCWSEIAPLYKHPKLTSQEKDGAGQLITDAEERAIITVGMQVKRRQPATQCIQLMLRTGMGFGELRRVKRRDIDLEGRRIRVDEGAKNDERRRSIPLTDDALRATKWLIERWEDAGGTADDQYVLFWRKNGQGPANFYKPMSGIYGSYGAIVKECKKQKLLAEDFNKRIYDCRVTVVTRLLSNGTPAPLVRKIAAHSALMQRRYYKPDEDDKRSALSALDNLKKPVSRLALVFSRHTQNNA